VAPLKIAAEVRARRLRGLSTGGPLMGVAFIAMLVRWPVPLAVQFVATMCVYDAALTWVSGDPRLCQHRSVHARIMTAQHLGWRGGRGGSDCVVSVGVPVCLLHTHAHTRTRTRTHSRVDAQPFTHVLKRRAFRWTSVTLRCSLSSP
jgi:hypothetical protein